jgi:hypothetical protein
MSDQRSALEKLRAYVEKRVLERNEPLRAADEIPMQPTVLLGLIRQAETEELHTRKALFDEIKDHTRTKMEARSDA